MTDNMQFPIPNSVLEPYIRAAVSTAIASALGDGTKLVERAVTAALTQKVNAAGKVSNSNYENTHQLVDIVATNSVHKIAQEVIVEMAESMRPQIKAEITKQLKSKHGAIAQTLVDGLLTSLKTSWNIRVEVTPPPNR